MKRTFYKTLLAFGLALLAACTQHPLWYGEQGQPVDVTIRWADENEAPATGMRLNLFPLNGCPHYGIDDKDCHGGRIWLPYSSQHMVLCYDYFGSENVAFRNEHNSQAIESYTPLLTRATYSRAFPTENTVSEPGSLHVDKIAIYGVQQHPEPLTMDLYPANVVQTYTFEVRRVRGAQYITAARGALSGVSASYFLSTGALAPTASTVLFAADKDGATDRVTGSFRTFGLLGSAHTFTIEILYPSAAGGIIQRSWDVAAQLVSGTHIVVDADIDILPDAGDGSGFEADVLDWEDVTVPIPM